MQNFIKMILNHNIGLVCIVILLGFLAHSCMLAATFKTLDDNISIINNEDIKDFANTGKIFTSSFFGGKHYYRPIVSLSYMVEYHFVGLRSFFYNLTNLAFHLSIAVTVFFIASYSMVHIFCEDEMRGKIFSSLEIVIHFAFLMAMITSSWMTQFIAEGSVLIGAGVIVTVVGLIGFIKARRGKFAFSRKSVT